MLALAISRPVVKTCGMALIAATVGVTGWTHFQALAFLRAHALLSAAEATPGGMAGAVVTSQFETLSAWLFVSAVLTASLRVWLPSMKSSVYDIVAVVALSHLPLLVWSIGAASTLNVSLATLDAMASVHHWTAQAIETRISAVWALLIAAKWIAYACCLAVCARLLWLVEPMEQRVAIGSVLCSAFFCWALGRLL